MGSPYRQAAQNHLILSQHCLKSGWFSRKRSPNPKCRGQAHRRGRASNLRAAGPARWRLGRRPGIRPRDLLFLQFAAGARPSSLRPWLLGPGRRRLRRKRRRRRRRWLRRRRRPAQLAMSSAAAGNAPVLASARWNPGVHDASRLTAVCLWRRSGSQGLTASGPTAARRVPRMRTHTLKKRVKQEGGDSPLTASTERAVYSGRGCGHCVPSRKCGVGPGMAPGGCRSGLFVSFDLARILLALR